MHGLYRNGELIGGLRHGVAAQVRHVQFEPTRSRQFTI